MTFTCQRQGMLSLALYLLNLRKTCIFLLLAEGEKGGVFVCVCLILFPVHIDSSKDQYLGPIMNTIHVVLQSEGASRAH